MESRSHALEGWRLSLYDMPYQKQACKTARSLLLFWRILWHLLYQCSLHETMLKYKIFINTQSTICFHIPAKMNVHEIARKSYEQEIPRVIDKSSISAPTGYFTNILEPHKFFKALGTMLRSMFLDFIFLHFAPSTAKLLLNQSPTGHIVYRVTRKRQCSHF